MIRELMRGATRTAQAGAKTNPGQQTPSFPIPGDVPPTLAPAWHLVGPKRHQRVPLSTNSTK